MFWVRTPRSRPTAGPREKVDPPSGLFCASLQEAKVFVYLFCPSALVLLNSRGETLSRTAQSYGSGLLSHFSTGNTKVNVASLSCRKLPSFLFLLFLH